MKFRDQRLITEHEKDCTSMVKTKPFRIPSHEMLRGKPRKISVSFIYFGEGFLQHWSLWLQRTEVFCWTTERPTSDKNMFCFIVMPRSQLGLLEALSLSSILCQLLLGLLAAFLPDLTGFKGSLRELTCSHDANMRHWETVLDSFLSS